MKNRRQHLMRTARAILVLAVLAAAVFGFWAIQRVQAAGQASPQQDFNFADPPYPDVQLLVNIGGTGNGSVISNPAGIDCPAISCVAMITYNSIVTLTANTPPGVTLVQWVVDGLPA